MTNLAVDEEIAWLRGFGEAPSAIAAKLAIPVMYVLSKLHDYSPTEQEIFDVASAARREARLVYGRSVKEFKRVAGG